MAVAETRTVTLASDAIDELGAWRTSVHRLDEMRAAWARDDVRPLGYDDAVRALRVAQARVAPVLAESCAEAFLDAATSPPATRSDFAAVDWRTVVACLGWRLLLVTEDEVRATPRELPFDRVLVIIDNAGEANIDIARTEPIGSMPLAAGPLTMSARIGAMLEGRAVDWSVDLDADEAAE